MTIRTSGGRDRGAVLLLAIIFTFVIGLLVAGTVTTSLSESRSSTFSMNHADALARAEGTTEVAQKLMLDAVANFSSPTLSGNVALGGETYLYNIQPAGPSLQVVDIDGVTLVIQPFEITAQAEIGNAAARVQRVADLTLTPIFQYMIFYDDDLEILPGPAMTLGGRVHSNGSIFVGSGNTLTVDSNYLRATGEILRQRKNDGTATGGTINIKVYDDTSYVNMAPGMDSNNTDWVNLALDTWGGTVQSGVHGVAEVAAPSIGSIKAFDDAGNPGYYHESADLVVVDGQAYDTHGNLLALPPGVVQERTMFDGRENRTITVTDIDLSALAASGQFPANGLIYSYRTDASSTQPNGIRLINGAELAAPLTVVTEDPLFIKGDFNTVNKKGAAVMADAVNLLSNAWNDTKVAGSLPNAASTTYNVAMVTGNVPTPDGGGAYSGGFENLPRFHESWSGRTCSIRGSFIKIYDSEIATAPWAYGGQVYTAPIRDWQYDPDLNDLGNLPPFTPNAVYFRRVLWSDFVPVPFQAGTAVVVDEGPTG